MWSCVDTLVFLTNSIVTHSWFLNQNIEKVESVINDIQAAYDVTAGGIPAYYQAGDDITSRVFTC